MTLLCVPGHCGDERNEKAVELAKWYTDGSKTSTGAGAGIFGPSTKGALSLGSCMSVFQAEILAIERCLDINLERNYQKCDIAIHSDSQAAIKALSSYVIGTKVIWECRNKLNEIGKKNKVFLTWVPGHSGIKGNEEANTFAKEDARLSLIGPELFCGIGKCIYKEFLEKAEREKLWRNLPGMDHSLKFLHNFETARFKRYLDLGKKQLHLLTGFLTGSLRKHLLRMGLSGTDECRFCGEEEEAPIHLITECFAIASLSRECLRRETCKSEELVSLKPSQILDFIRSLELEGKL